MRQAHGDPSEGKKKPRYSKRARFWLSLFATLAQVAALVVVAVWVVPTLDISIPNWVFVLLGVALVGWDVFTYVMGTRALDSEVVRDIESMAGLRGVAVEDLQPSGRVRVRGELWQALSVDGDIEKGEQVEVTGQEGLTLKVKKIGVRS